MKRSAFISFAPGQTLALFLGAAALALAPQLAFAQHAGGGGGGHAGGGMSSGGHFGGGGGSPHFSSPPPSAPHNSPPPAPHAQPAAHSTPAPTAYVPPRVPPAVGSVVNNQVVHPATAPGNQPPTAGFAGVQPAREPLTIGFPPPDANQPAAVVGNSATSAAVTARSGQPLRFFGEGHQIYSEPAGATISSSSQTSSSTLAARTFRGPAALMSATAVPVAPPHITPPHIRVPPGIIRPGFGTFGFGGFGAFGGFGSGFFFGSPYYFGNPFFFGDPLLFGDPFLGYGVGSVWVPCNGYGPGLQCMAYNGDYGYEQPYTSTMIGGTETETQSQQIFSPYSPALPPAEENNTPSPNEFVLFLKDGSVYVVNDYWYADGRLVYTTGNGQDTIDLDRLDIQKTLDVNAKRGMVFTLRPSPQEASPDQGAAPAQPESAPPQPDQQPQPNQTAPAPQP